MTQEKKSNSQWILWLTEGDGYWERRPLQDLNLPDDYFTTFPNVTTYNLPGPTKPIIDPWEKIALEVMAGKYTKADLSIKESIRIGLTTTATRTCNKALKQL